MDEVFAAPVLQEPGQGGQEEEEDSAALGVSSCVWSVTGTLFHLPHWDQWLSQ